MKMRLKDKQGGALLFAIITAFVISMTGASLVALTTTQYRLINNEIKRKESYYWIKSGREYANFWIRNELSAGRTISVPNRMTLPENSNVGIVINTDPTGSSDYKIVVNTTY